MAEPPIRSLHTFIERVNQIADAWEADERTRSGENDDEILLRPWFRGHSCASWSLQPSIYRDVYAGLAEDALRRDFYFRGIPYFEGAALFPRDDWEWYFVMRHHGLPTRLLDWTEGALIALYFAVRDTPKENEPATVWMLDPWFLNDAFIEQRIVPDPEHKRVKPYLRPPYAGDETEAKQDEPIPLDPVAIRAKHTSRRIAAQRGVFTIHGRGVLPLEEHFDLRDRLLRIDIARDAVGDIRRQLARAGVTEALVYPDLSGICQDVLNVWTQGSSRFA